ncbi:MAG: PadR family transcriptional regulator [Caldisericaceae bacterium]
MRGRSCRREGGSCFSDIGISQNFWARAWFLASLSKGKSYGYELMNSIPRAMPAAEAQSSSITGNYYRILRALETDGLITSEWDTSGSGPARRIYSITEHGKEELNSIVKYIEQTEQFVKNFLNSITQEEVK